MMRAICSRCNGSGKISGTAADAMTGRIDEDRCPECYGSGTATPQPWATIDKDAEIARLRASKAELLGALKNSQEVIKALAKLADKKLHEAIANTENGT